MLDYQFDPNSKYIIACSYGSDSMSLLDMMQKDGVKPIVCFVNYHKFKETDLDQKLLEKYCLEKGLTIEVMNSKSLPKEKQFHKGEDYKEWARTVRYSFFKAVMEKYKAVALFVAHQQDDLIQTYLLQKKQKKSQTAHYGFGKIATMEGIIVVRPLLNFTKQDLIDYDEENHVPYSKESGALIDHYSRDPIAADVANMSEIERANIIEEMDAANSESSSFMNSLSKMIDIGEELNIREIMCLDQNQFAETIIKYVRKSQPKIKLTASKINEIRQMALAPQPNISMKLAPNLFLIKEYDVLTIGSNINELPYCYTLEKGGKLSNEHFDLDFSAGAEDRGINDEDYPLTIRTALPGDNYIVHGYLTPVRRLFIDWKMPPTLRCLWPIFVSKDGRIIFIPRYNRLDRGDYKKKFTSKFKLKILPPTSK